LSHPVTPSHIETTPVTSSITTRQEKLRTLIDERIASQPKPRGRHAHRFSFPTKPFRKLSDDERTDAINGYIALSPALAFTLHFDTKRHDALKVSTDPVKMLADEINRLARKVLGDTIPFMFVLEVSPAGRLHAHGVIMIDPTDKQRLAMFRQVMKQAAGVILGGAADFQLATRKVAGTFWTGVYCIKDMEHTRHVLRLDKITYTSRKLTADTRAYHDRLYEIGR
jgi:hypothetical protein